MGPLLGPFLRVPLENGVLIYCEPVQEGGDRSPANNETERDIIWGMDRLDTPKLDTPVTRCLSFTRYLDTLKAQKMWKANSAWYISAVVIIRI